MDIVNTKYKKGRENYFQYIFKRNFLDKFLIFTVNSIFGTYQQSLYFLIKLQKLLTILFIINDTGIDAVTHKYLPFNCIFFY